MRSKIIVVHCSGLSGLMQLCAVFDLALLILILGLVDLWGRWGVRSCPSGRRGCPLGA
jgi:hypothetical protein